jgi:hypothetical protein
MEVLLLPTLLLLLLLADGPLLQPLSALPATACVAAT